MQTRYTSADQWAEAKDGVIPAPYALEEGEQIIDQYLEPVIFHNVNGPDIGVTTCGVIVKDENGEPTGVLEENAHNVGWFKMMSSVDREGMKAIARAGAAGAASAARSAASPACRPESRPGRPCGPAARPRAAPRS